MRAYVCVYTKHTLKHIYKHSNHPKPVAKDDVVEKDISVGNIAGNEAPIDWNSEMIMLVWVLRWRACKRRNRSFT